MDLRSILELHEGLRLKAYKDTLGYWTIGYGHLLGKAESNADTRITLLEAEHMLDADIAKAKDGLANIAPWYTNLDAVRQAVLIDMTFNLGAAGLAKWPKFLRQMEEFRFADAAANMLSTLWARQVKDRAGRLARMVASGEWPK